MARYLFFISVYRYLCFREDHVGDREEAEDTTVYKVGVNHEEQYSIWPNERPHAIG